jgi:hypothetical protein
MRTVEQGRAELEVRRLERAHEELKHERALIAKAYAEAQSQAPHDPEASARLQPLTNRSRELMWKLVEVAQALGAARTRLSSLEKRT